ncbi:hypothetical protein [Stakelama pacifica]|uniref:Uncharacterized protein n=1 Tax=Stakelama pacifica TaxID=517720 RepID=A0A4R6FA52_9SPHN|nr:hypothetical protein [Stakelama pacifica]TDN77837.1 hypothetical protein EV664_1231 [Stakelama pacifica]GGP00709.1 hypothetical protein GCM10011329_37230 [Stakelama pacifica]
MNPNAWLDANAGGFSHLDQDERCAIYHFALLWSLLEAKLLETHGSPGAILDAVERIRAANRLDLASLAEPLAHFRARYWQDGKLTARFDGLNMAAKQVRTVQPVLAGHDDPAAGLSALLLIVHRLRNNLFHGPKWSYGIADQRENFENANLVMIGAMDMYRPLIVD